MSQFKTTESWCWLVFSGWLIYEPGNVFIVSRERRMHSLQVLDHSIGILHGMGSLPWMKRGKTRAHDVSGCIMGCVSNLTAIMDCDMIWHHIIMTGMRLHYSVIS